MATLLIFSANTFIPDDDAQLVAGDLPAGLTRYIGRPVLTFDPTDEEAATSAEVEMPSQYTGSGLTAKVYGFATDAGTSNFRLDVYVEAVTPDSDTLDMETATSWGTLNSISKSVPGTAGNLFVASITLTNADSVAVGDIVRIGIRRDTDHGDDAQGGDFVMLCLTLEDDG